MLRGTMEQGVPEGRPTLRRALSVAEELLGRSPDRTEPFEPSTGDDDSHSFRIWAGGDAMLLKIKKHPGSPIGIYFHGRIKHAGVPAPELITFSPNAGPGGEACAIWKWVKGKPAEWSPEEPCPYDEVEFGELLRRIHDLKFDGPFGFLGDDPPARPFPLVLLGPKLLFLTKDRKSQQGPDLSRQNEPKWNT